MSATTPLLPNGSYAILSAWLGSCVTSTDNISSPQVQSCDVSALQQQPRPVSTSGNCSR
ncbi:hypothetical protein L210DRAFT_573733 [Boletus edulis BED1]|uniref:Uncharacterized protein n=1 Tax=Boletus edulis BED1 TaxID=1328754 RepID=A0AAD4GLU8_BOLED|nr:hypothetical protein L210DRAFT_573733 [Boletus edulis BED1]